jgi:hypothetical protein
MAKGDPPFQGMSDMMQQGFEQTSKAMDNYLDLFKKSMNASPWFASSDLNKKMQGHMEQNITAASDFAKKLTQAKNFPDFLRIQTEFVQEQWKAFSAQMMDLGETVTKGATGALKDISS